MAINAKDSRAILENLINGKALPPHLCRSRAGVILPKHRNAAETLAEERRAENKAIAARVLAKMDKAPLVAVCIAHKCSCGNSWQTFGFYGRKVSPERIQGEADASFIKPIDYNPAPELPQGTEWQDQAETTCIACYGGMETPPVHTSAGRIGGVTMLAELLHTVKETI